ncbi:hypothetical protein HY496_01590 [Candidatus Woesearchaeota archaeon]|nr:hypothetical protein [Candidatus Woesearchaeota archaeon]
MFGVYLVRRTAGKDVPSRTKTKTRLGACPQSNHSSLIGVTLIASRICAPSNMVLVGEGCFLPDLSGA